MPLNADETTVADLIALGTVMSNNLCGGAQMSFRAGRIDATAAGVTTGVPAPETNLEETLLFFERAGFDKVDAIGLTACGHTMGSVHHVRTTKAFHLATSH
jgi:catalase (peroxidase I)